MENSINLSEKLKINFPLFFVPSPLNQEALRQQVKVDTYKIQVVVLTGSKEAADSFVELALIWARETIEPNERVFDIVMKDIIGKLARGDSVADVADWVRSNIRYPSPETSRTKDDSRANNAP